jgi:protease-4
MDQKRALLILALVMGGLFSVFVVALVVTVGVAQGGGRGSKEKTAQVGVVEVVEEIRDAKLFTEQLRTLLDDDDVKAVVVRVDSPGGNVGASQEMRAEITRARQRKKVVASLGNVAASGGYYAAVGAEKIVSNPGTLTGSIGVIMQHAVVVDLMRYAKLEMRTYASGALKDSGSAFRLPTAEDQAHLQGLTQEIHAQFVGDVASSRGLERDRVAAVADGRVITGQRALELGLVDQMGTLRDAAALALKLAGVEGEPELVYPPKKQGLLAQLMETGAASLAREWRAELGLGAPWAAWAVKALGPGWGEPAGPQAR